MSDCVVCAEPVVESRAEACEGCGDLAHRGCRLASGPCAKVACGDRRQRARQKGRLAPKLFLGCAVLLGQAGVRSSVAIWKTMPEVQSDLWNLNGLSHKIVLENELLFAEATDSLEGMAELLPAIDASHRFFHEQRDPLDWNAVAIVHPWESGMDNSPIWDASMARVDVSDVPPFERRDTHVVGDASQPVSSSGALVDLPSGSVACDLPLFAAQGPGLPVSMTLFYRSFASATSASMITSPGGRPAYA